MRPTRGPFVRSEDVPAWFLMSSGLLLFMLVAAVPIYFAWPGLFDILIVMLMTAVALNLGLWTLIAGRRGHLQPHQVAANIGMMAVFVALVVGIIIQAPDWAFVPLILAMGVLMYISMERRTDDADA